METKEFLYRDLAYKLVGLAMEAHRKLGHGFLEKIYENALMVLFRREGIIAEQQAKIQVFFEGEVIGDYVADILVEGCIIIELKAQDKITDAHRAQILNYLKATGIKVGYLLNFGKRSLEYERFVL